MNVIAAKMTEVELQHRVIGLCRELGVMHYHEWDSRHGTCPGWPDSFMAGRRGILARELKSAHGRLTVEQRRWGSRLVAAGVSWSVWRPCDWMSGVIREELERIALRARVRSP